MSTHHDGSRTSGTGPRAAESRPSDPAFLRLLAHELRNHIAPVHNAMHLLRLKLRGETSLAPVIDLVERQLVAMSGTLDAVSDMERVRRGELTLDVEPTSLRDLLERALRALPSNARRDRIVVDVDHDLETVEVDASRLTRVFTALFDNALRYAPGESPVNVGAHAHGGTVEITIDDAGPGMDTNARKDATEFFALPHQSGHGLGLGLPLAAAVMELHGGSLALEPSPQGGLRVAIKLLRNAGQKVSDAAAAQPSDPPGTATGRRVLLADDSAAVRASLTDLLQEMGHEVRAVGDGAEAVTLAQAWVPEFVLLDVHMPKLNGFEAARRLRALFPSSAMQLVMLSGEGLDDVVRQGARQAGFDHCIDKGLAIGELTTLLARAPASGEPRQNSL